MPHPKEKSNAGDFRSLTVRNIRPTIADGADISLPLMAPVRQIFPSDRIDDIEGVTTEQLMAFAPLDLRGKRVAVTAGSRGIKGIVEILRATVGWLRNRGAEPFLVPAMGSHGAATADGQIEVLKKLGITEASVGAPIRSSMAVVELGTLGNGMKVYCDKLAFESDGIVVCNRIKPHTAFKGEIESGLVKMMVIGLGKHKGATAVHQLGFDHFDEVIPAAGGVFLAKAPILFGLGMVENAYGKVAAIKALSPERLMEGEADLLKYAKRIMGRIYVSAVDVLIVDEIGKDISGGGMDANVTGRSAWGLPGFDDAPPIQRIVVRDLTEATAGSSMGLGLADFTTRRCAEKIDLAVTYTNALTALALVPCKIPMIAASDRDALLLALKSAQRVPETGPRIVQISNTKDLEDIWVSEACLSDLSGRDDVAIMGGAQPFGFDDAGAMTPWPAN